MIPTLLANCSWLSRFSDLNLFIMSARAFTRKHITPFQVKDKLPSQQIVRRIDLDHPVDFASAVGMMHHSERPMSRSNHLLRC